jgi:hypothetical protein
MTAVLDELRAEGYEVLDEDVKHLSPARHEHINPHGKYRFDLERELVGTAGVAAITQTFISTYETTIQLTQPLFLLR